MYVERVLILLTLTLWYTLQKSVFFTLTKTDRRPWPTCFLLRTRLFALPSRPTMSSHISQLGIRSLPVYARYHITARFTGEANTCCM